MKKGILITLGVIAVLMLGFVVVVAMQPSHFHFERSTTIAAPPEAVFEHINDMHKAHEWSPWLKLDPNAKYTFEGPSSGKGATQTWSGNDDVGAGKLHIVESKPYELVRLNLEFDRPMQDVAEVKYVLKPEGDGTKFTWSMDSEQSFMEKGFCMFINMEKMLGPRFDEGLANLKKNVETAADKATDEPEPKPTEAAESPEAAEEK